MQRIPRELAKKFAFDRLGMRLGGGIGGRRIFGLRLLNCENRLVQHYRVGMRVADAGHLKVTHTLKTIEHQGFVIHSRQRLTEFIALADDEREAHFLFLLIDGGFP